MAEINAITLYVSDIQRSVEFYSQILEREALQMAPVFAVFVQESGARLVLMANEIVEPKSFAVGGTELAFGMYEDAEVDTLFSKWAAADIPIAQLPIKNQFAYSFLALDPDGHRLRVYCHHGF